MRRIFLKGLAGVTTVAMVLLQMPLLSLGAADNVPDFSVLGAVGSLSEEQTQCVAQSIYKGLSEHAASVRFDYSRVGFIAPTEENLDALMDIYVTVVGGWDVGILAVKNHASYSVASYAGTGYIAGMGLLYLVDDAVYDAEYASLMEQLDTITAGVDPAWSAPEKALYLHEYLAVHYDYDYDAVNASTASDIPHSAYGILTNGKAVCEGYTWLYNLLLRRVGIESIAVVSTELNHTWNVLYIDSNWYHADVTWDDNSNTHPGRVRHDGFLKDRDGMAKSGYTSTDWMLTTGQSETILPESDKYNDAFWTKSNAAIVYYQGTWLAVCPSEHTPTDAFFTQYTFDAADGTAQSQDMASVSNRWMVFDKSGYYYNANYAILSVNMGTLYYTTPTSIMGYQNDKHVWICDLTEEQQQLGYIYGMYTEGDTLYYAVSDAPNTNAEIFSISLTEYRDRIRDEADDPTWTTTSAATTTTATTTFTITTTTPKTTAITTPSTTTPPQTSDTTFTTVTSQVTTSATESTTISTTTSTAASTTTSTVTSTATSTATSTTSTTTSTTSTVTSTATSTATSETTNTTEPTEPTEPTILETPSGDLDGDGILTVQDVVALNRYILGVLPSDDELHWQNADLMQDGVIDVFDLAMLKRALLAIQ